MKHASSNNCSTYPQKTSSKALSMGVHHTRTYAPAKQEALEMIWNPT